VKILLVDDDPVARRIHSMLLQSQGHEVEEASDGEHAWRAVQESQISFVVSDWMMPRLAGVDLCRRIRTAALDRYIYVILCTSRGEKADLIEGMDAGADDFLVKPVGPEELRVKVRAGERVLSLQQGLAQKNKELARINSQLECSHKLIEEDLRAAAWMQQRLLPSQSLQANGLRCKWRLEPSGYVAGDIFNFFAMDEGVVGFYILDVSGHGVPAAMLSVTLSMILTPDAARGSPLKHVKQSTQQVEILPPGDAIRELNRRFQSKDDRYFTMVYGLFDIGSGRLRVAQAGHPGPILITREGQPQIIGTGGMPIGLWPDIKFDCIELPVNAGDRLLLYSDGVTECVNSEGEAFGEARLLSFLAKSSTQTLDAILDGLLHEIRSWRHGGDPADDISFLAIELSESLDPASR
jgi:sigma-B regulation protein RsbU (phosphoserine phosphatase)